MTDAAITRVEQLASEENQPWIQSSGLLVEWRPNDPFDDDDDPDYVYSPDDDPDDDDEYSWDTHPDDVLTLGTDMADNNTLVSSHHEVQDLDHSSSLSDTDDDSIIGDLNLNTSVSSTDTSEHAPLSHNQGDLDDTVLPQSRYNLRPARERTYEHRLDHLMDALNSTRVTTRPHNFFSTRHIKSSPLMYSHKCPRLLVLKFLANQPWTPYRRSFASYTAKACSHLNIQIHSLLHKNAVRFAPLI
jgi:hypothetical protein